LDTQEVLSFAPLSHDLVGQLSGCREPVIVGLDDALETFGVDNWFNFFLVVANQVVVQLDTAWLFLFNNQTSNLEEIIVDLRVFTIPLGSNFHGT